MDRRRNFLFGSFSFVNSCGYVDNFFPGGIKIGREHARLLSLSILFPAEVVNGLTSW